MLEGTKLQKHLAKANPNKKQMATGWCRLRWKELLVPNWQYQEDIPLLRLLQCLSVRFGGKICDYFYIQSCFTLLRSFFEIDFLWKYPRLIEMQRPFFKKWYELDKNTLHDNIFLCISNQKVERCNITYN